MPDSYPVAFRRRKREDAEDFVKAIEGRAKGYGKDELGEEGFFSLALRLPHNPLRAPKSDSSLVLCVYKHFTIQYYIAFLSTKPAAN